MKEHGESAEWVNANVTDAAETAKEYHDTVLPAMAALRAPIDELETIVDSEYWPVPTYGELMFEV